MRHGTSNRRSRNNRSNNNNNRGKGGNNRAKVFDSNGPEVRIRGTAHQIFDKYTGLAKDASSCGDMVLAESYLQHAEHYQRIISTWDEQAAQKAPTEKAYGVDGNKQDAAAPKEAKNDDLGLPNSILGDEVKVATQGVRESQAALEDA
jgi:hypothetical protein